MIGWPDTGAPAGGGPDGDSLPVPAISVIGAPAGIGAPTGNGAPTGIGAPNGAPNGAPTGTGAPNGAPTGTGAAGITGTGPGTAIGTPAISDRGALAGAHTPAAAPAASVTTAGAPPAWPADDWTHSYPPPVMNGTAAACGLNAMATLHNPVPATTTVMLNRSKIVIDIDSFIRTRTFRISSDAARPHAVPKSLLDDRVNYQQPTLTRAPRRTAPFPNGDVRQAPPTVTPELSEKAA